MAQPILIDEYWNKEQKNMILYRLEDDGVTTHTHQKKHYGVSAAMFMEAIKRPIMEEITKRKKKTALLTRKNYEKYSKEALQEALKQKQDELIKIN